MKKLLTLLLLSLSLIGIGQVTDQANYSGLVPISNRSGTYSNDNYYQTGYSWEMDITGSSLTMKLSTVVGDSVLIDWGDGDSEYFKGVDQNVSHTYLASDDYTITITEEIEKTLTMFESASDVNWTFNLPDILRGVLYFNCYGSNTISGDLADLPSGIGTFYCSGSNTISGDLADLPSGVSTFYCSGSNTISGDLADLPSGVSTFLCYGSNTISGDLADLPSDIGYFHCSGSNTISGDLADLPSGIGTFLCSGSNTISGDLADLPSGIGYFRCNGNNTISDYSGKTWTTKPATLMIEGYSSLSGTEVDQLLIDLDDDLAWSAGNVIIIKGNCGARTSDSDAAVSNMTTEGASIETNP